jgi:hypothetical protein
MVKDPGWVEVEERDGGRQGKKEEGQMGDNRVTVSEVNPFLCDPRGVGRSHVF